MVSVSFSRAWPLTGSAPEILLTIGVAGVAFAGLLIGLSPNYVVMALLLVVNGAGWGRLPSISITSDIRLGQTGVPRKSAGVHQIGGTASFFLAPLIAAGIASALGWRGTFITIASPDSDLGHHVSCAFGKDGLCCHCSGKRNCSFGGRTI
jgi:MFS family permease